MGPKANDVRDIVNGFREQGLDVGLRDISCAILVYVLDDRMMAYRSIFGDPENEGEYNSYWVKQKAIAAEHEVGKFFKDEHADQMLSFDDLKQGLIDDMNSLIALRDAKKTEDGHEYAMLEPKEMAQVVARIADIRVKLTEKFNTTERVVEQRVVVENKYDAVCPHCHHEISIDPSLFEKSE